MNDEWSPRKASAIVGLAALSMWGIIAGIIYLYWDSIMKVFG